MKTEIIRIREDDIPLIGERKLKKAGEIIRSGGIVAFPTETVYGLGGNAFDKSAAEKIYAAKNRPSDNPLIVHIADKEAIGDIVTEIPPKAEKLMDAFWPGPLTMILGRGSRVPLEVTGGLETVAVRMPSHAVARAFIRAAGGYVVAPSANLSGHPSPTTAEHVIHDLKGRIDMIIDSGSCVIGLESTIIDLTVDPPVILRPGHITLEDIENEIGMTLGGDAGRVADDEVPKAPGMKYRHYAPKANLTIIEGGEKEMVDTIRALTEEAYASGHTVGIIATDETKHCYDRGIVKSVGSRLNEDVIGYNLYNVLREFDSENTVDVIYSETFPVEGYGAAIMNRLTKAAGGQVIEAVDEGKRRHFSRIVVISDEDIDCGPMAAAILSAQEEMEGMTIESRGLYVLFPEPLNPKVEAIMASHGVLPEGFQAHQLTEEDIQENTVFITMNGEQKQALLEKYPVIRYIFTLSEYVGEEEDEVAVPYGEDLPAYARCYDRIEEKINKMVEVRES